MRLNQFVARATGCSRRAADDLIAAGRVTVDGQPAELGQQVGEQAAVVVDGQAVSLSDLRYVLLNKPAGYVTSRDGQGQPTIYELLPEQWQSLKPVGRLDADSAGLLLLTNDGPYANRLLHPSHGKAKRYQVTLDKPLTSGDRLQVESGVALDDGTSALELAGDGQQWEVTMHEGRNRQIRRTFGALGYEVLELTRLAFGPWTIGDVPQPGDSQEVHPE